MFVIYPVPVEVSDLVSYAATEPNYAAWDAETTYSAGARVATPDGRGWVATITSYTAGGTTYTNLGNDPAAETGFYIPFGAEIDPIPVLRPNPNVPTYWWASARDTSAETDPAFIDEYGFLYDPLSKQVTGPSPFSFTVKPRYRVSGIALFNVKGTSVSVTGCDTKSLLTHDSFGDAPVYRTSAVFLDFPEYVPGEAEIMVTITNTQDPSEAGLGRAVFGIKNEIGLTNYGTELSFRDFSRIDRDEFGLITIIRRDYASKVSFKCELNTDNIDQTRRLLAQLRATPAVFVARENRPDTLVYGFYDSFKMPIAAESVSSLTLNTEGLV